MRSAFDGRCPSVIGSFRTSRFRATTRHRPFTPERDGAAETVHISEFKPRRRFLSTLSNQKRCAGNADGLAAAVPQHILSEESFSESSHFFLETGGWDENV
jgi:hypothetical protein